MSSDDVAARYGPWAIVTGASSGLGEGFAHALAARGIHPVLVARRGDELARVAVTSNVCMGSPRRRSHLT